MANIIKTPPQNNKKSNRLGRLVKSKKNIALAIVAGLIVLGVVVLAWLLLSGRMVVIMKQPSEELAQTRALVCDSSTVDTYNTASFYKLREGSDQPSMDTAALNKLTEEIKSKDLHAADPTCQAILFWTAVINNDAAAAEKAKNELVKLHDDGQFVDNNLSGDQSLTTYTGLLEVLKQPTQEASGDDI